MIHVESSKVIDAAPAAIYAVLSDYRVGHPAIVPKAYFKELTLEQGGQGAGTVVLVRMEVMGLKKTYRLTVSEPEPGRVLVETDQKAGVTTTFTVEPLNGGKQTRVTIASDTQPSPGIQGRFERLINPPVTRRIYQLELQQLADYVGSKS